MIPAGTEVAVDAFEYRFAIVADLDRFSMNRFGRPDHFASKVLPDRLMPQADAEDRSCFSQTRENIQRNTRTVRGPGAWRDQDLFRPQIVLDLVNRNFIIPDYLHVGTQLAQILHEVVRERINNC